MPYMLNWFDEAQTILHVTADGTVTWDEYHTVYDKARELVQASSHRVDVIADSENRMPPGNPLPHFSQLIKKWDSVRNFGNLYVVRKGRLNGFIQSAAGIAGKMTRTPVADRVLFIPTLDEALQMIRDATSQDKVIGQSN
jgi:hypothetical protein